MALDDKHDSQSFGFLSRNARSIWDISKRNTDKSSSCMRECRTLSWHSRQAGFCYVMNSYSRHLPIRQAPFPACKGTSGQSRARLVELSPDLRRCRFDVFESHYSQMVKIQSLGRRGPGLQPLPCGASLVIEYGMVSYSTPDFL